MPRTKAVMTLVMLAFMLPSCIIPYEPHIDVGNVNKFVVSGQVTDNNEFQTVSVSMASPIDEPQYIPVSGCFVRIFDDKGNEFEMHETEAGLYKGRIEATYLTPGTSFKVDILTSDGISLESDFDRMSECPEIDSVYYIRKEFLTDILGRITNGLQFYLDLNSGNIDSHFFRWEAIETWEHHAKYPRQWYWDGAINQIYPPDYSRTVCWSTQLVKNIYTLSTEGLVKNKYLMFPLEFVDNHTPRLVYGYSLLINQFALSEAAYSFWDQLRINSTEQGGLYEKQPLSIVGNLHNITNPDQAVLGFFSASSVKSKRIFVGPVKDLAFDYTELCQPAPLTRGGFLAIKPREYPAYLMGDDNGWVGVRLSQFCVDCTSSGGTTSKPVFWPE